MKDFCIILVFDKAFWGKAISTIKQIREVGLYSGEIVCVTGDDLKDHAMSLYDDEKMVVKYFPDVGRTKEKNDLFGVNKPFQFHKFYCFHKWFRDNYKRCFYIDVGMQIFKPLDKMINLNCDDKLLAHSDAYPTYKWKLSGQFDKVRFPEQFMKLSEKYNMGIDYFQSTIMLYDTSIISDSTFDVLVGMSMDFHNNKTNTQGFMNLYFTCLMKRWEQIKMKDEETHYYDFFERKNLTTDDYIMLKYPKGNKKKKFGGWSISEELFNWISENLAEGKTILELGSGKGTVELTRYYNVYSIEHNKRWVGYAEKSTYIHAPIVKYDGYLWYDAEIVKEQLPKEYDLILVDGPPGDIGRGGFLKNIHLFNTDVPIIIDDSNRKAEGEMLDSLVDKLKKKVVNFSGAGKKFSVLYAD